MFFDNEGISAITYGDTHTWEEKETFLATIQVLKCKDCDRESIGWTRFTQPSEDKGEQTIK